MQKLLIPLLMFLVIANPMMAQSPAGKAISASTRKLGILPLEGEGAINFIPAHIAIVPVVEVRDENDRPVEGASVTFSLPETGPGGSFPGGQFALTKISDQRGQAAATGFSANSIPGQFLIRVTAYEKDLTATAFIHQTNSNKMPGLHASKSGGRWKWVLLGIAAGAGAGAGIYFARKSSTPSPISISTGSVVFGSPR